MEGKAQYPFGYGLNYGKAVINKARLLDNRVVATVENQGKFDTQEVFQVYIKCEDSDLAPLNPQLCAFKRFFVKAGERVEVELTIPPRAFTVVDEAGNRFTPGGLYKLYAGFGQPDERTKELTKMEPVELEMHVDKEV